MLKRTKKRNFKLSTPLSVLALSTRFLTAKIRVFSARSSNKTDPTWNG